MCCRRRGGPSRPRSPPQPARSAPSPAGGAPLPEPPPVPPQPRGAPRLERGRGAKRGGPGGQGAAPGSGGARPNPPVPGHLGSARASPAGAVPASPRAPASSSCPGAAGAPHCPICPFFFPPVSLSGMRKRKYFVRFGLPLVKGELSALLGAAVSPGEPFCPGVRGGCHLLNREACVVPCVLSGQTELLVSIQWKKKHRQKNLA